MNQNFITSKDLNLVFGSNLKNLKITGVEIDSRKIGELVMIELKKIDSVAYIRFSSVYREFKDLSEFQAQIDDLNDKIL